MKQIHNGFMMKWVIISLIMIGCLLSLSTATEIESFSNTSTLVQPENSSFNLTVPNENTVSSDDEKPINDRLVQLIDFVQEAITYAHNHPKEEVLAEFSNRNGSFFRGDLYIYAYDFNGTTLAHPLQSELIGKSRLEEPDAMGELFIKNLRDAALNGSGFVIFHYQNPANNSTIEKKLGYVEAVDDTWFLGSGIYGDDLTIPSK